MTYRISNLEGYASSQGQVGSGEGDTRTQPPALGCSSKGRRSPTVRRIEPIPLHSGQQNPDFLLWIELFCRIVCQRGQTGILIVSDCGPVCTESRGLMWSHTSSLAGLVETLVRQGADIDSVDAVCGERDRELNRWDRTPPHTHTGGGREGGRECNGGRVGGWERERERRAEGTERQSDCAINSINAVSSKAAEK